MRFVSGVVAMVAALVLVACGDATSKRLDSAMDEWGDVATMSAALVSSTVTNQSKIGNCGDGVCSSREDCVGCPADCGACDTVDASTASLPSFVTGCTSRLTAGCPGCACEADVCATYSSCCTRRWSNTCARLCKRLGECGPAPTTTPSCGDGACNGTETCATCVGDCGACPPPPPVCGDGACNGTETCADCDLDCGACPPPPPTCGDGACNGYESCTTCALDCGGCPPACGDGECNGDETCATCVGDCGACPPPPPVCGDGACNGTETCATCAGDCGACPPPPPGGLPMPWVPADVGAVGTTGTATEAGGVFALKGAGADIWSQADDFYYVYQSLAGDGQIVVRLSALEPTDPWAKVGVMMRESLAANARHAMMVLTPGNGAAFQRRDSTGGWSQMTSLAGVAAPGWLRLVRAGNTFTGYFSIDRVAWTKVGSATFALPTTVLIGLVVSSGSAAKVCAVTYDNVTVDGDSGVPTVVPFCGDGACNDGETCTTCAGDCGACPPAAAFCGDGTCNGGETCTTCASDCGACPPAAAFCGDGACNGSETCTTCAGDCGACPPPAAFCGDGACNGSETCVTCAGDCGACATTSGVSVAVQAVTSTSVTVTWAPVSGATGYKVWMGPEPADASTGVLPAGVQEQSLGATTTSTSLSRLAAATDVFVMIVATRSGLPSVWGQAHARTLGGQGAVLGSALREVHAVAPRILEVVLANPATRYSNGSVTGNLGASFQAGQWQVTRANGALIPVSTVYRHSLAVGQPDYPVGYNQYGSDDVVDVDHRIFLVLAETIGSPEVLTVQHTGATGTALDVRVPFSDRYLETPVVQVNQVGYNPRASRRWAYVSGWLGDGGALSLADFPSTADVLVEPLSDVAPRRATVANLPVTTRKDPCPWAGAEVREIDLATVAPKEGRRLRVRLPGVGVSYPTAVSEEAAAKAFFVAWRGMYLNRWCGDLDPAYTDWSRPEDHCKAYFVQVGAADPMQTFPETTPKNAADLRVVRGGHHDAGDFDLRPYHVLVGQYLLRAYEQAPQHFSDGQLYDPESGNGIPDALDEALWSVAAWEALQNDDGSVRMGVESFRHPAGIYVASDDQLPYWTYEPVPWHTAYSAALFAQAAWLVAPFDATRAAALRTRAAKAYTWAVAHAAPTAYLLYAASELFRATGQASYGADFVTRWNALNKWGGGAFDSIQVAAKIYPGAFTGYAPAMADFVIGYATAPGANSAIVSTVLSQLTSQADQAADAVVKTSNAYRHARSSGTMPDWGVDVITGRDGDMIYQRLQLGGLDARRQQDYLDALSLSADYQLGCNPAGTTFITGLGSRSPRQPLHNDSLAMQKTRGLPPVPGISVYGPVDGMPGSSWYQALGAAFYPAFDTQPGSERYLDSRTAVNMSEFSVWETMAPTAQLFAALVGSDDVPPDSWLPGGAEHRSTLPGHFAE